MVSVFPSPSGLRAMLRSLSLIVLGTSFVTMSSCCFTEQGNHAVRKMWCDYNTLRAPAFYLEQEDHLPYPAPQVGYYRWMYDKDPGHQLACLGPIPPRTCAPCDRVPAGNEPFEYEVYFPTAIPRQSDQLWGNKLPEPINVPGGPNPSAQSNGAGGGLANAAPKNGLVPILPSVPPPVEAPKAESGPPTSGRGDTTDSATPLQTPSRLPTLDLPAPQSKPLDDTPAPLQGPAAQQGPSLRLTTDQPASSSAETVPAPDAVWPR
jgi:hypothetical protein